MANKKNYSKMSTAPQTEVIENEVVETAEVVTETSVEDVEEVEVKNGCVINCSKLNIRKDYDVNAKVIGTLNKGETVVIIGEYGDFYAIDRIGYVGYCMKKYISVNE